MKMSIKKAFLTLVPAATLVMATLLVWPFFAQWHIQWRLNDFRIDSHQMLKASLFVMDLQKFSQEQLEVLVAAQNKQDIAQAKHEVAEVRKSVARSFAEWEQAVYQSDDEPEEIVVEGDGLKVLKKDLDILLNLSDQAMELARAGEAEEAIELLEDEGEPALDFISVRADSMIYEESAEIEEELSDVLGSYRQMMIVSIGETDFSVKKFVGDLKSATNLAAFSRNINRAVKELIEFSVEGEESELQEFYESNFKAEGALLAWQTHHAMKTMESENLGVLYKELNQVMRKAVSLVKTGQRERAQGLLHSELEKILDDGIRPLTQQFLRTSEEDIFNDISILSQSITRMRTIAGLFSLFIIILGIGMPILLYRHLMAPLLTLTQAVEKIGHGDLGKRVQVKSVFREIDQLAVSFNEMADNLTMIDQLKQRVSQSEKMASIGQLAGGVAHEINNPLGVILGFSQILVKSVKPEEAIYGPLKNIEKEAVRCKDLVQDLLQFARNAKVDQYEQMDANAAIRNSLTLIETRASSKDIKVETELDPELPLIVGNKSQLQQIVVNLANNAVDAMNMNGELKIRTRRSRANEGAVEIQVEDNGGGIPKEIQEKIFEPFFTTKEVGKGTGLGLSLVYEIVKKHNGKIELESTVGKGTVITVLIPEASPVPQAQAA